MVIYGFLTYYLKKHEISIPNKELFEKFKEVLQDTQETEIYYHLKEISSKVVKATLNMNSEAICKLFNTALKNKVIFKGFYSPVNLGFIVHYTYFDVRKTYTVKQEEETGEGMVDYIFLSQK